MKATRALLILSLGALAAMQAVMLWRFEINWDEFLNLSMVYQHRRGELDELLQTVFVHLFGWLPAVSGNEAGQVIAARGLVAVFVLATVAAIYAIARRLTSAESALFAVLAYGAVSYVFNHALALRTDALATGVLMVALWLALSRAERWGAILLAGVLTGLAGALTIKSVFFVPSLVAVAALRAGSEAGRARALGAVALAGVAAGGTFVVTIAAHSLTFDDPASPLAFLDRTMTATLGDEPGSIFLRYAVPGLIDNAVIVVVALAGLVLAVRSAISGKGLAGTYALALALPVLTPLLYRDVYPYIYPMLLAPAAPLAALAFQAAARRASPLPGLAMIVIALGMAGLQFVRALPQDNAAQRRVLTEIGGLFDADTPYVDGRSMVASRPKVGLFMSVWGMTDYRRAGQPVMAEALAREAPAFLLETNWQLRAGDFTPAQSEAHPHGLLAEDVRVLERAFLPFWGPLRVAGARLPRGQGRFVLHRAGTYRVTGAGPVTIDGQAVAAGGSITLDAGSYSYRAGAPVELRLDIDRPGTPAPEGPLFKGF